jgi:hypothetical protein
MGVSNFIFFNYQCPCGGDALETNIQTFFKHEEVCCNGIGLLRVEQKEGAIYVQIKKLGLDANGGNVY